MDNKPNQAPPKEQPDISEVDARIAAEQYVLNQPTYGYETSSGYAYDESVFGRIISAIATNKLLLIPLIAIPIIILGSVLGASVANNSAKTTNSDDTSVEQLGETNNGPLETVSVNSTDNANGSDAATTEPSTESTDATTNNNSNTSSSTQSNSNGGTNSGTGTATDLCRNLEGTQTTVPSGYKRDGNSNCSIGSDPEASVDLCLNLDGNQTAVPSGYRRDGNSNCTLPTDLCKNIEGNQATVPPGYTRDSDSNCTVQSKVSDPPATKSPTDLCKNIEGNQATVPAGKVRDSSGNCKTAPTEITKVLIVIEENTSSRQVNAANWPYAYSLTRQYAYATRYTFLSGSSLPNYIAMAAGTIAGVDSNNSRNLMQKTIFKQMIESGKTAKTYAQNMSGNCSAEGKGGYVPKHNPWIYFANERSLCKQYAVPATRFGTDVAAGQLPNLGMLIPDNNYNSHDGSSRAADQWFKDRMATVFAGPDWKAGRLAIIFVFDEPKKDTKDNIYMSVIHPSTKGKGAVATPLNHYSITRLGAEMSGKPPLAKGASANSIIKAFGLDI